MSKAKKVPIRQKSDSQGFAANFSFENMVPSKFQIPILIGVIVLLLIIFLNPLFLGNKTFQSGDIVAIESQKPYVEKEREGFSLWNPYIFAGMPAHALSTEFSWFNLIATVYTFARNIYMIPFAVDYAKWTFYLVIMGITAFFFVMHFTKNKLLSLFASVATIFSTGLIVFLFIGHVTKLTSLCMYPLIFLILFRMQEKIRLLDIMILIIALQVFIQGFHVQIIFYTLFAIGIYFIYYFLRSVKLKDNLLRNNLLKSAGIIVTASIIATAISGDNLTQVYEYSPYSTRGGKSIVEINKPETTQSESEFYDYHTGWSFSPEEILTFIVPSFYGFGNSTYKGPLTQNQPVEVNTYFGQMPFVDVAMYMGVLIFFLALFAIFTRWKEPLVRFLTILIVISLFISFGKNLPIVFDLMFYYFPYFDKFRVPSMILVLIQINLPILAALGIQKILELREKTDEKINKIIKNAAFVFSGLFVISILLNSPITEWFTGRINSYADSISSRNQQLAQQYKALAEYSSGMFYTDLLFAMGICAAFFWAAVSFVNKKLSRDFLIIIAVVLSVIDLWRVDSRGAKYIDNPDPKQFFEEPEYVRIIKNQGDKFPFRILNIKQDGTLGSLNSNSNFNMYFLLEDLYGYSGIKPRTYQDYMDVVGPVNQTLWRMLNVKYLISTQALPETDFKLVGSSGNDLVYENLTALPRIYFVDKVETKDNLEVLNLIKNNVIDPKEIAFVHNETVNIEMPDSTVSVNFEKYTDEKIIVNVTASGNNFLFFGNTYLPTGWKAYIGEDETKIYQTNHGFMGIIVPKGNHKITFEYAPVSFAISKNIALILSALVLLGLILTIFSEIKRRKVEKINS